MIPRGIQTESRRNPDGIRAEPPHARPRASSPTRPDPLNNNPVVADVVVERDKASTERLRGYLNAPEPIREAFDRAVAAFLKAQGSYDEWESKWAEADEYGAVWVDDWGAPPPPRVPPRPEWNESWERRAERYRRFGAEPADDLRELDFVTYVTALGCELVGERCECPVEGCEGSSLSVRQLREDATAWACFRCNGGGTIYDFAGALWGLETRGSDFREIAERLRSTFQVAA